MISASVQAVFDSHRAKHPELSDQIDEIKSKYVDKFWHPITDLLIEYTSADSFKKGGSENDLLELFNAFVIELNRKINQLKYAQIAYNCTKPLASLEQGIEFLESLKTRLQDIPDGALYLSIVQAEKKMKLGNYNDAYD